MIGCLKRLCRYSKCQKLSNVHGYGRHKAVMSDLNHCCDLIHWTFWCGTAAAFWRVVHPTQLNFHMPAQAPPSNTCQRLKGSNMVPAGLLHPLETPSKPWEHISANFITDLPPSHSVDTILTVIDRFSNEVELIACTKTCLALDMAKLFMHNMLKHHRLPHSITSD